MEKIRKITTIILWVLMAISVVLFAVMITSIDSETNPGEKAVQLITTNINWAILLFGLSALTALLFSMGQMFSEKRKAIRAIMVLAIFAVILLVAYFSASSEIPQFYGVEKFIAEGLTETISHWVGTGLYVTYILFGGAVLSIVGFGAASIFKR